MSWDTRTRTRNDRTRICSVTITPYPKLKIELFDCWDTRTRTRNDRTRICSVTITPYPNISKRDVHFSIASAKVLVFFEPTKFFGTFF